MIEAMTQPPEVGRLYKESKVVSVKEFGVFVEIIPGVEGLCHVSELSENYVKRVEDVCNIGDIIPVKLLSVDEQGRYKLSRRAALAELGIKEEKREDQGEGQKDDRREGRREGRRDDRRPRNGGRR
jgi:polyribonucleotide nucleotidyltransferase